MKIASKTRLSLRKLFTAMLAVGPLAVLPSPVWAVLPTASSYTVTSGSATLSSSGNTVNINFSDKTILTWLTPAGTVAVPNRTATDGTSVTNFIVDVGDTWNFASAGSILNKVTAGSNLTNGSVGGAAAAAIINGQLLGSNARVFVLANGGIVVGNGAQLNTQSLVLSTLGGENDGTFITLGDLTYNGASTGSITIGTVSAGGNVTAQAGSITTAGTTVGNSISGDLVLRTITAGTGIVLSATTPTTVGGNLTVTTNNGTITQGAGFGISVGSAPVGLQTATLNSGTAAITLNENTNNFERVVANTSGLLGSVSFRDADIVTLGASNIGGDLTIKVGGRPSVLGIETNGAVAVGGNASLDSTSAANSGITLANGSSVAGFVTGQTSGGAVTLTTVGNLTVGSITNNVTATSIALVGYGTGLAATATTDVPSGTVNAITLTPGTNPPIYTGNVATTISSPIASATPHLQLQAITLTDGGSGYLAAPAVTFPALPAGAVAPTATATIAGGVVTGIAVVTPGSGWTTFPTASIAAPPAGGTQANAITTANIAAVVVPAGGGGSGQTAGLATPVTVIGGGGSGATVTVATLAGADAVATYAVGAAGTGYTSMPSVVVTHPNPLAVPAVGLATRDATTNLVTSIAITNAGVGYGATAPVVSFPTVNTANNFSSGGITANTTGVLTTSTLGLAATGLRSSSTATLRGSSVTTNGPITVTGNGASTFTSTAGDVTFGSTITANRVTANATGNITDKGLVTGLLVTNGRAQDTSTLTATQSITLDTNDHNLAASQLAVTAANASIRSRNNVIVHTTNVTGNYSIRAEPAAGGGARTITLGRGDGADASVILVNGTLNATTGGTGGISDNNDSRIEVFGTVNLQTGFNNRDTVPANPYLAGGAIVLDAAMTPGALTPSVRWGLVNAHTGTGANGITIAENPTANLGNVTGSGLTVSSSTGGVIDSGVITLGAGGVASFTVTGSNNVVLDTATNVIPVISVNGGVNNSFTGLNSNVELRSTTNATGTTTLGTNNLFAASLGSVVTTGDVVVNSGSWIDILGNANITGNLTLNATGNVTNAATFSTVYAGTVTRDNTTGRATAVGGVNLPLLSYATAPTVTVVGGALPGTAGTGTASITNAGGSVNGIVSGIAVTTAGAGYTIAPTVLLSAPPVGGTQATATATVAGGVITGYTITNGGSGYIAPPLVTLTGGGTAAAVATAVANLGPTGQITGFNVTNSLTNGGTTAYNTANPIRVDIAGATTTSVLQSAGTLKVSGTTTIASPGNALLFRNNNFANVVLNNSTGGVLINDVDNVTVSGMALGNVDIRAGSNGGGSVVDVALQPFTEANPWAVTLGSLNVGSLNVTAGNGGAGNSGRITQSANATIHSFGSSYFTTSNNTITVGNNGNNFGRVGLFSGGGGVTFSEDGTMKIGNVSTGNGTVSLTSRFGGIWEDPAADVLIAGGNGGTINFNSPNGSVLLGNLDHVAGGGSTTVSASFTYSATAGTGAVKLLSTTGNVTLGAVDANSLTVASGNNITQNAALQVFGSSSFTAGTPVVGITAAFGGNITLTNNANNFGRISLVNNGAAAANIAVTEGGTVNLGRASMVAGATGNFTATSINGDVIDTGLGGVRPGGTLTTPGTGVISLSAVAGHIQLDDPTTDFPSTGGVVFNSGNVLLAPLGGAALYLGAVGNTAVATGNLTVTSATGSIFNSGPVNVTGDAWFQVGNGNILMTNASNNFGAVKFNAGSLPGAGFGIVSIAEAGHISLVTGSSAVGAATFTTTGGDISIANRGGTISLASTGLFNASGAITLPKLIQVSDTLTVSAAGTKDLSKLSVSGDLNSKSPQNFGTGTYVPPGS